MADLANHFVSSPAGKCPPFISIVIPVRNEEPHIGRVLACLEAQRYPRDRFEILVVDGNSTDKTVEIAQGFARRSSIPVRVLPNKRRRSSAGRNTGVLGSKGDLIIFVDGHCHIPSLNLFEDTVRLFEQSGADCLCRPQPLFMPENTWFQNLVARTRSAVIGHGRDSMIYETSYEGYVNPQSSGASYRRSVFARIGLYDERFEACEDVDFNFRVHKAKLRSYTSPRIAIHYWPRKNLIDLWKQMVGYGRGRVRLSLKHSEAYSISQTIPALLVIWLASGLIFSPVSPMLAKFFVLTLGIYMAVLVAFSILIGLRGGWRNFIFAPLVFMTIHFGLGTGLLVEAFESAFRCALRPLRSSARQRAGPRE